MKHILILDRSGGRHFGIEKVLAIFLGVFTVGCWCSLGAALSSSLTDPDIVIVCEQNADEFEYATRVIVWSSALVVCLTDHPDHEQVRHNGRVHCCDLSALHEVLRLA